MSSEKSGLKRRTMLLALGGAAAVPAMASAKKPAAGNGAEENQAIALVKAWAAALVAKDLDKALSYMDEACQYRDDPFQIDLKKGRALLTDDLKIMLRGLVSMDFETIYAVGSKKNDVLLLGRRIDVLTLGPKKIRLPIGTYYRVRNGKILEWLDTPLEDLPPPPSGVFPLVTH